MAFFGSDGIALPLLDLLHQPNDFGFELSGVLTQPDRPAGRGKKLRPNPVKAWAAERGLNFLEPERPGQPEVAWVRENADLVLVMAYGHILYEELLEAPVLGTFNFHGSILPSYRGASPVETALAMGEDITGVTLMRIVPRMDAGPIVDCETIPIADFDDGPSLRDKLAQACVPLLQRNLGSLLDGLVRETPQDEQSATYCRKLCKVDGALDFKQPAEVLARRVAAFRAWPGCYFDLRESRIKVGRAEALNPEANYIGGEIILSNGGGFSVGTPSGALSILEMQRPGGRMLPAADFLRGFSLLEGELAGSSELTNLISHKPKVRGISKS